MRKREIAKRVFAREYNESTVELRGDDMEPSYVVTKLGAKINRLFIAGFLVNIETIGGNELPIIRAKLIDHTAIFDIFAGQYQPQPYEILSKIDAKQNDETVVGIIGKTRVYHPEEGVFQLSVRPEYIKQIDVKTRNYWILETCEYLKLRIDAIREAMKMEPPTVEKLCASGFDDDIAEGVVTALQYYGTVDVDRYYRILIDGLQNLLSGYSTYDIDDKPETEFISELSDTLSDVEQKILRIVEELSKFDNRGAIYTKIIEHAKKVGIPIADAKNIIENLLAKGLIMESEFCRFKIAI
jgi:hypothetical protein